MRIFLIGMMGSGKSYCAKLLAKKLKTSHYDLDNLIELAEEKTIAEIFEEDGEPYFRQKEAEILRWFAEKKVFVAATGGGTPCFHDNMKWMNQNGITVWLNEPVAVLVNRLKAEKAHRPLIKDLSDDELYAFLENKLAERRPFYETATHIIEYSSMKEKDFLKLFI
ncbi:shikimate kinase [Parasediminibacterium sp. JCM 36343]|uniref:shikimate kinase n=1 Tax=Parasediminibacterium sp. JCM 36343 TaxID=3374279 RepID=UPI003978A5D0